MSLRLRQASWPAPGSSTAAPPSSVSTDSGWNWTPSAGSSRWRTPISTPSPCAVSSRQSGSCGVDHQRVIAPDRQRRGQPAEDRATVVLDASSPCRAPARAASSARRTPAQAPDGRGTHPSVGIPASGIRRTSLERDAGLHPACTGPARRHSARSRRAAAHRRSRGRCAPTCTLRAQLAQVLHEVVGERVVVVEDEHLHRRQTSPAVRRPAAIARITARDFATDSSYSYSGFASATVPPPACTCATPSLTTTVRMWIAVSRSPA